MFYYEEIRESQVDEGRVALANELLTAACHDMGINRPPVRWLREVHLSNMSSASTGVKHERAIFGAASPDGEILIRADLSIERTAETALHELRHSLQFKHYGDRRHVHDELTALKFGEGAGDNGRYRHIIDKYVQREKYITAGPRFEFRS